MHSPALFRQSFDLNPIGFLLMLFFASMIVPVTGHAQQSGRPIVAETYGIGEDAFVRALAVDKARDSLWVGTSLGVMQINLATRVPQNIFTRSEGLANEHIHAAGIGPGGRLWLGTNAGGLSIFDGKTFQTLFPMHGLADYWVKSFGFSKDGMGWVGTLDGVSRLDGKTGDFDTFRSQLIDKRVEAIAIDPSGRVWLGTYGGVSMYDGVLWWSYRHEDGLGAKPPQDGPTDSDETIAGDYNPNQVLSALTDNQGGGVWFGTWGGGVSLFDGKSDWRSYSISDGLAGPVVYSMAQEESGVLWFGTNRGVSRFDGDTWQTFSQADGLASDNVYAVAVDHRGMIWAGGRGGLSRIVYDEGR